MNDIIEILAKLLFVIEKTHVQPQKELFDDQALGGILNFVCVRNINRDYDFKDVVSKYEQTLNSIKNFSNVFYSKELSYHKTLSILTNYTNGYNNILSRSTLMFNLNCLSGKLEADIKAFFYPFLKNEVLLYVPPNVRHTITQEVIDKALENSYSIFYDVFTKFTFDKEKQFINIQKVFKELNLLIKWMVI